MPRGLSQRAIELLEPDRPAVVLGSAQRDPAAVLDVGACERSGIDVVRRQSGGGVVLLEPGDVLWVDALVPRGDVLWDEDVGRAMHWVGDAWAAALGDRYVAVRSPHEPGEWGRLVCFAGVGPGEVVDAATGRKVVGVSQRRTRDGARFQCAVLLAWRPERLRRLLAPHVRPPLESLRACATTVPVASDRLVEDFLAALP